MQLEVGGNDGGCEFGISGGTGSGAPDLRSDIVQLLAVLHGWLGYVDMPGEAAGWPYLVRYYGPARRSCVCCNHHAAVE